MIRLGPPGDTASSSGPKLWSSSSDCEKGLRVEEPLEDSLSVPGPFQNPFPNIASSQHQSVCPLINHVLQKCLGSIGGPIFTYLLAIICLTL